jgi:DNA-binding XRE family transcriptional regulator
MASSLRDFFGLTQERLAAWLGVSRVILAQSESGQRALPMASSRQDVRLTLAMHGQALVLSSSTVQPAPLPLPTSPPDLTPLAHRLVYSRYHALRLGRELAAMQARATQLTNRLTVVPALRAYTDPVPNPALEADWLAMFESEAVNGLRDECGLGFQQVLAARRAGLLREIEVLEELLNAPPAGLG